MNKQIAAIAFCVVAVLVCVISFSKSCSSDVETATRADWMCADCGNVYEFTESQMEAHYRDHYGEPLTCPACDSENVFPAKHCPNCKAAYLQPGEGNRCPNCGEPLPPPEPSDR